MEPILPTPSQPRRHKPTQTFRGTLDEVFGHRDEIPANAKVELRILPEETEREAEQDQSRQKVAQPKQLRGRGMLAGVLSSEDFLRCKHAETILEDRSLL